MLDKFAVDALLERGEPPLHGGLADAESFRRRQRAAFARDRQKIAQIIPVKHDVQHLCRTAEQSCGCSALRASVTDRARSILNNHCHKEITSWKRNTYT